MKQDDFVGVVVTIRFLGWSRRSMTSRTVVFRIGLACTGGMEEERAGNGGQSMIPLMK
jgi:hypothetical protein